MERGSARSSFNHMKIPRVFVSPPTRQDPDEIGIGALRNANVRFWPNLLQKSDARDSRATNDASRRRLAKNAGPL